MASEDRERRHLHERLEEALGGQAADHLLEGMAILEREQRTTAQAVDLLRADMELGFANLRHEMAGLRGELRHEMAELRGEMYGAMGELRHEMAEFRDDLHGEVSGLRGEFLQLRADMFEVLHEQGQRAESQFRTLLFAMLGTVLTVAAMAFGAASL